MKMKKIVSILMFFLAYAGTVSAQTDSEILPDSIEYTVMEGIVKSQFGVFVVITAEEYDDPPYKDLVVELMGNIDKSESNNGESGWVSILKAKVIRTTKDDFEVQLLEDVLSAAAKKGVKWEIKKGMTIQMRWPEITY